MTESSLEEKELKLLADGLQNNFFIQHLDLRLNNFESQGFLTLVESLYFCSSLRSLWLSNVRLNDKDAQVLITFLNDPICQLKELALVEFEIDFNQTQIF